MRLKCCSQVVDKERTRCLLGGPSPEVRRAVCRAGNDPKRRLRAGRHSDAYHLEHASRERFRLQQQARSLTDAADDQLPASTIVEGSTWSGDRAVLSQKNPNFKSYGVIFIRLAQAHQSASYDRVHWITGNAAGVDVSAQTLIKFFWPTLAIWLINPTLSLIDTAVVGSKSSAQLAALGPGCILCDCNGYLFTFLAVASTLLLTLVTPYT